MKLLIDCTCHCDERPRCIAEENGKRYELINNSKKLIRKVKVDGCFPQQEGEKRCDYLMCIEELERAIFIELKGAALNTAVRQLYLTILYVKNELVNYQIDARIVGKGGDVPKLRNTPDYLKLKREVELRNKKGSLEIRTNSYSETI